MAQMIQLINVSKSYDNGHSFAVQRVSLQVYDGEILVILGSSGSGKTTLLKMINRLITPTEGVIKINAVDISLVNILQLRRSIGYVFQGIGLFPHMSVEENISVVLRLQGMNHQACVERAHYLLSFVNLNPSVYAMRMPGELSGGEQQRVGVARALANEPSILLMDEPFGALDSVTRHALQDELLQLNKRLHKTILFVTHDIFEALRLADRIAIMHEGKLAQIGTQEEIINQPATDFVRELFAKAASQAAEFGDKFQ